MHRACGLLPTELEILVLPVLWKPEQHKPICCVQSVGLHVLLLSEPHTDEISASMLVLWLPDFVYLQLRVP